MTCKNPFESLRMVMDSSVDWLSDSTLTWIQGIVHGFTDAECRKVHDAWRWSNESMARLQKLHDDFEKAERLYVAVKEMI